MQKVASKHISQVDYQNGILTIKFHDGGTYQYHGVTVNIFQKFLESQSKSEFFRNNVKGKYHYGKVAN